LHCLSVTFPPLCGTQNMRTLIEGDSITCPSYGNGSAQIRIGKQFMRYLEQTA